MNAVYQSDVPVCSVVIRKAYGLAGSAMMNQSKTKWRYCWPSGDWGSLPMAGGIEAAFRKELAEAEDPEALIAALNAKFKAIASPFRTAESFYAEEIIDPRDTRPLLVEFVEHAEGGRLVTWLAALICDLDHPLPLPTAPILRRLWGGWEGERADTDTGD